MTQQPNRFMRITGVRIRIDATYYTITSAKEKENKAQTQILAETEC